VASLLRLVVSLLLLAALVLCPEAHDRVCLLDRGMKLAVLQPRQEQLGSLHLPVAGSPLRARPRQLA
jgi:hypothetical protein